MRSFNYQGSPARILFGSGAVAQLPAELDLLGRSRILVVSTAQQAEDAERITAEIKSHSIGAFTDAELQTPVTVTQKALSVINDSDADGVVAVGGGSAIGLGKAIVLRSGLPLIALPTTYAGSEVTPMLSETDKGAKLVRRDPNFVPAVVIYDVDLTLAMSMSLTVASAFSALAHAAEALYAPGGNPVVELFAEAGIAAFAGALPALHDRPHDVEARSNALYGAWLCGTCLGQAETALHHKLCHTLGGLFDLPHAETHAVVLPHALRFNASAATSAMERIERALNVANAATGVYDLARQLGAPTSLRELGMPENGIDRAVDLATKDPYPNPRQLTKDGIRGVIRAAWEGARPGGAAVDSTR